MIVWPRVLFPFPYPSCFNSELNCHLFKEAFCDSPPYTHTTKSLLLAPSGSTSLTDTLATFPCGFRAGATSALFAALSHRMLGTQQVLNRYFLNKWTIQQSNRTWGRQRKQKSSQNYPHTLTHILIFPQKIYKKGDNIVSFVSEQSSMYMEDGNKRWMEKRRPGRQAGSSRDQVQDKEGLIQVTISMDGQENWKIFKRDIRCKLNKTWWQACKWRVRHREESVTSSLLTWAIQWAVPLLTEKEMGGRERSLKHELYLEHVELDVPIGLPRGVQEGVTHPWVKTQEGNHDFRDVGVRGHGGIRFYE